MTTYRIIAAAGAALALAGLLAAIYLWRYPSAGERFRTRGTKVLRAGRREDRRQRSIRLIAAVAGGCAAWLLTGWPVAGLIVAAVVIVMPFLLSGPRINRRRIERLEALEEWTRRLAVSIAAGSPPLETIEKSANHAPLPLKAEIGRLATRLRTPRLDRSASLRQFADEVDDQLGDIVAIALTRAVSTLATERTPMVLEGLAAALASEVRTRRAIEKDRTGPRRETLTVVIIVAIGVTAVTAFTSWTTPYETPTGQVILAVLGAGSICALWMMRRLSTARTPSRILSSNTHTGGRP